MTAPVAVVPALRRQFVLPEDDAAHLDSRGLPWETIVSQGERWLLVHEFRVPSGYNHPVVIVAIHIVGGYPTTPLDMVYVHPPLARSDGRAIGALTSANVDGRPYQRWSRHRTSANPWRPGIDDIATQLSLVEEWFAREFRVR